MKNKVKNNKGFTLIELLVVIAIIGMLSTVVLASLNTARTKANVALIKQQLSQMRSIALLEYSDKGNYNSLASGSWIGVTANVGGSGVQTCDQVYPLGGTASRYMDQINAICKKMISFYPDVTYPYHFYILGSGDSFSAMTWTNVDPTAPSLLYCVGSSGRSSYGKPFNGTNESPSYPNDGSVYNQPGCSGNP